MKVVIDSAIPYIRGILEPFAETLYLEGGKFTREVVADADALIIRTRTQITESLLEGSKVSFIATATIGKDHIDETYCQRRGIAVSSAPGCNARGVLQWVAGVLHHITTTEHRSPESYTLGVVGVGNVGSLVTNYARHWGFKVMECDPPRQEREGGDFSSIEEIVRNADIITLHTPLDDSTRHLINNNTLAMMRPETIVVNASRGAVVDNDAVLNSGHRYIYDVWEGEPNIKDEILEGAMLSTPHIAGYSIQGKANATAMCVRALANYFDLPLKEWYPEEIVPTSPRLISWEELCSTITDHIDIIRESEVLRSNPTQFEALRNSYAFRQEYF